MTRTKIPIDNRPPFQEKIPSDDAAAAFRPPVTPHPRPHTAPSFNGFHRVPYASARSLSGPSVREICNQMPNPSISAPPPRSYRLRRHFPRHCDVTTRVLHPYKPRFLRYRTAARSSFASAQSPGSPLRIPGSPVLQSRSRHRAASATAFRPRACALKIRTRVRDLSFEWANRQSLQPLPCE